MSLAQRYHIADGIQYFVQAFGLDPQRGLRRAGLSSDFLSAGQRPVSAQEYYAVFDAFEAEMAAPDLPLRMANLLVESSANSSDYSFYCSPTVRVALQRKALLKPLVVPLNMWISEYDQHVVVSFASPLEDVPMPGLVGWLNLAYFLQAIRNATGENVNPAAVEVASPRTGWDAAEEVFGCPITQGRAFRFVLSAQDANLPLVTRNDAMWTELERGLQDQFTLKVTPQGTASRVRQALVEGLPGGQVSADQVARALALSKRSLQRRLGEEGLSFKEVLEDTRQALALTYLKNSDMSVQEIALLLGFRDPSSFFRAFRAWTGTTPQSVRRDSASGILQPRTGKLLLT